MELRLSNRVSHIICLVVEELDAGIFEYMLGELLDIFNKSAKGQMIFTSHNLRALEMLDKENIIFSTANPENRYIRMKSVRDTNNLHNLYIRSITLGGQDEVIYEETDSLKISRAFRKAGRGIKHERKERNCRLHYGRSLCRTWYIQANLGIYRER